MLMDAGGRTVLVCVLKDVKHVFNIQAIVRNVWMVYGVRIVLDIAKHLRVAFLNADKPNAIYTTVSVARNAYRVIGEQIAPAHVILMTAKTTYAIKIVVYVQNVMLVSGEVTAVLHAQLRSVPCARGYLVGVQNAN